MIYSDELPFGVFFPDHDFNIETMHIISSYSEEDSMDWKEHFAQTQMLVNCGIYYSQLTMNII